MVFEKEQAEKIKEQLLSQVDSLPNENKEDIKEHIKSLDEQGLEDFLKQNNIQIGETGEAQNTECIFCSIIKGTVPSHKIAENKKAITILELNPLSKGHVIIIPKNHVTLEKLPKTTMSLAQKMAGKIKSKLKPEDVRIETSSFQGHAMINVIPIYKDTPLQKTKADEKELKKIQSKLETKTRSPREKKEKEQKSIPEISFRIP